MNDLPRKYRKWLGAGLTGLLIGSAPAMAQDIDIDFAGFATLAYGKTLSDDKKEGPMHSLNNEGEYRDFNKLGFRMDADLKDNLRFTAQILAQGSENYDPSFDWIFATYQLHPEWALSVGRIRVPVYMYSDYLDTSYAYQWIEPPKTVYNLMQTPFKSIEGVKLAYTTNMGDWTSELLLWAGKGEDHFMEAGVDSDLILEDAVGTAWTVGYEWLSLRGFYFEANATLDLTTQSNFNDLNTGVMALETALSITTGKQYDFQDELLWERDKGQFYGLGAALDFDSYFFVAEATRIDVPGKESNFVAPRLDSYYVMAGVRLPADVTLSLTYGEDKDYVDKKTYADFNNETLLAEITALTLTLPGVYAYLDSLPDTPEILAQMAAVQQLIDATPLLQALPETIKEEVYKTQDYRSQNTTLGVRWDFHRSASAKFEYIYENREGQSAKANGLDQPHAFRIGLDLVF